jgi:Thioredoxin-like [2Fe-2S] ferredoxin
MSSTQKSSFCLVGQLEGYDASKSGKIRHLRLGTAQGMQQIKLKKSSHLALQQDIFSDLMSRGVWVEVSGQQKTDSDGTKSFKAQDFKVLEQSPDLEVNSADLNISDSRPSVSRRSASSKILICQKSSCRKRGSAALQRVLEQELGDRQLLGQVSVKATGCLKHCSKGPNVVFNKTPHRGVGVKDLPKLLDRHFAPCPEASRSTAAT